METWQKSWKEKKDTEEWREDEGGVKEGWNEGEEGKGKEMWDEEEPLRLLNVDCLLSVW